MAHTSSILSKYGFHLKGLVVFMGTVLVGSTFLFVSVQIKVHKENTEGFRENIAEKLSGYLESQNLDDNLRYLSRSPHVVGSERNNELAQEIARRWKSYGFYDVKLARYDILLSLPDDKHPSSVSIVDSNGQVKTSLQLNEKPLLPGENHSDIMPSFLSFAPNGTAKGHVVYANFGREEDFHLLSGIDVSVKGHITLVRQGRVFRGDKVKYAMESGAIGVLIYNDPSEFAPDGVNNTYPHTWWLPKTGIQRGAAAFDMSPGDVLTPGYPSIAGIYRAPLDKARHQGIPAHDITYEDAYQILKHLKGPSAPEKWQGDLKTTYKLGPGFEDVSSQVQMDIRSSLVTKPVYNVIGTIKGLEQPDRYVLLGNHRDAWVFGASDPSSGTSIMMELSRGFGELLKTGWRPRRTIIFCSWDAEEQFVSGSTEWVEDNAAILRSRAVAYLNLDTGVGGNFTLNLDGSPLMKDVLVSTAREVLDPTSPNMNKTLYDVMLERDVTKHINNEVGFENLAFGSDYVAFYHFLGITSSDMAYIFGGIHGIRRSYPLYHTMYDSYYWMKTFVDPYFKIHLAVCRYSARLLLKFADSKILPLNSTTLIQTLKEQTKLLSQQPDLQRNNVDVSALVQAVECLQKASDLFEQKKTGLSNQHNGNMIRIMNDQISGLERAWITNIEIPTQVVFRNVIYGPDWTNIYKGRYFPRVHDAIKVAKTTGYWETVKKEISVAVFAIKSAEKIIEPVV